MKVPKSAMTVAELCQPIEHGLPPLSPRFLFNSAELDDRVVRFAALGMTVGEFVATVESQTGLRRRFISCGNGSTILWGVDNIMYISFVEPKR